MQRINKNAALNAWKHLLLGKTALSGWICRTSLRLLPISSIHPHTAYINTYAIQSRQPDSAFVCQGQLSSVYSCWGGLQVWISCWNPGLTDSGGCYSWPWQCSEASQRKKVYTKVGSEWEWELLPIAGERVDSIESVCVRCSSSVKQTSRFNIKTKGHLWYLLICTYIQKNVHYLGSLSFYLQER